MFLMRQFLSRFIRVGTLVVLDHEGRSHRFGHGKPEITIRFRAPSVARRLALDADLALGETFMDGDFEVVDASVYAFLELVYANLGLRYANWWLGVIAGLRKKVRYISQYNPVGRAKSNVAHHYDLSGQLYDLFLDEDKQYSCAYFVNPDDSLEQAQQQKLKHIATKLLIEPGMRVLDIGSGWGGLGLYLARETGAEVIGVTLSEEQHKVSVQRAKDQGLQDRVQFLLKDYREIDSQFDRIVSVGMFEHVGVGHYREYFDRVRDLMTPEGVALLHSIGRFDEPAAGNPWISKYIFPGGYTPALSEVLPHVETSGLFTTDIEILRLHYAETLRHWRQQFTGNVDQIREMYDERFCRMWEFYLAACEASFRFGGQMVFQLQLSKQLETVPITRDYMVDWERQRPGREASAASVAAE